MAALTAEAPTLRPGLRVPSRYKGANQNNAPGTPKKVAQKSLKMRHFKLGH
jgi:hypothetical protein